MLTSEKSELYFQKGAAPGEVVTYPCVLSTIGEDSQMVNPCNGKRHGIRPPSRPTEALYEEEDDALIRLAMDVERGIWPSWYLEDFCGIDGTLSPVLQGVGLTHDPKAAAGFVRMDQPEELWAAIVRYGRDSGLIISPELKGQRFLERHVSPLEVYARENTIRMREVFEAKYYFGQPRPEEYHQAPNLTHYAEGCPNHPSYPAGHGTFAGVANRCFRTEFKEAQSEHLNAVETATKQLAHFRDFARVHDRQDSAVGWAFGNAA